MIFCMLLVASWPPHGVLVVVVVQVSGHRHGRHGLGDLRCQNSWRVLGFGPSSFCLVSVLSVYDHDGKPRSNTAKS